MSDSISRQEAINAIPQTSVDLFENCRNCELLDRAQVVKILESLPSAEPKTGEWIPVSERFPDAEECPMDCMVTRKSKFIGNYVDMAVAEANGTWTHEDWKAITLDGKATCISTRDADIIAWMPLPEPWKDGEEE